jgi:hypothetical protein
MSSKWGILIAAFLLSTASSFACEFSFTLINEDGSSRTIRPGTNIELELDNTYTMEIALTEDHRNCRLVPEDTDFLLEEEKWKTSKDYLPLQLVDKISWSSQDSRHHTAEISFQAVTAGKSELEVLRDCDKKEGYDEFIRFVAN